MQQIYYPQSPAKLPEKLTDLPPSYQFRATLAVLAIILFFVLYFSLVIGLGYLVYHAFIYDMGRVNKVTLFLKAGAIAGSAMLFVFTIKAIFKLKNHKPENRIKLDKKKYPELVAFIEQICKDTGAPKPKSIYVDPDVNAYVSYSNMWLSLVLPVKKDLTIGLGLVSCLNLLEFKAVMAHEFGHFAQRSMKIGSYIVSANTLIHDMIYSRDKWDILLEQWRSSDIRLSAAAWVITPVIWTIRQLLALFYTLLNIIYSSLSREMEFNADKVAVSTTGSEAIISALWKLEDGATQWSNTINHAYLASKKQLFVKNLYKHNDLALDRSAPKQRELVNALSTDGLGNRVYFTGSESSKVSMYASHPPNDLREKNAKMPFVRCETDDRSPWILFTQKEALQEAMTALLYKQYIGKAPDSYAEADVFEQFVYAETQGTELLAEYYNTFENRFLHIPKAEELNKAQGTSKGSFAEQTASLKAELLELMKPVQEIEALMLKAQQIAGGTTKEVSFSFNGVEYNKKKLQDGYNTLTAQRESLFADSFKQWDTRFCAMHLALAGKAGRQQELANLYAQHGSLNTIYKYLSTSRNQIYARLQVLQSKQEVPQIEIDEFAKLIYNIINDINAELARLDTLTFVPLPNIESTQELKEAIVEGGAFKQHIGSIFENGGFERIANSLESALSHCQRLDQKSIAAILNTHHSLQNTFKEQSLVEV
jgi:Zn-dependent protease with chaperone function